MSSIIQPDGTFDLAELNPHKIHTLSNKELGQLGNYVLKRRAAARKEAQILYYEPASDECAKVHQSNAHTIGIFGGNRSAKSETALAHVICLALGMWPRKYDAWFRPKFRGPINCRLIVVSILQLLEPVFLPKLQYFKWTGPDAPGGLLGHWGWVPRTCLIDGSWDKSWSAKNNTLRMLCRSPDDHQEVMGESILQVLSHQNDPLQFASGTFHHIVHDEPPPRPIWRESQSRVLDVGGVNYIAMTWSDDPAISQDWLHDEVYEKGTGPNKDPDVDVFELSTLDNIHLNTEAVTERVAGYSKEQYQVRVLGKSLTFANRIHPLFTDQTKFWSYAARKAIYPVIENGHASCPLTGSTDIQEFSHVTEDDPAFSHWPVVFVLDPHPRKPHMFLWVMTTPGDDYLVIADGESEGDPTEVRIAVEDIEQQLGLQVVVRLGDPNMLRSPAGPRRGVTWQDEFDAAGLRVDLADDNGVGRKRLDQLLQPDEATRRPRLSVHRRCAATIHQMKRYSWADYKQAQERDQKQTARDKYSDYPSMLKYFANYGPPTFHMLNHGFEVMHTRRYG